MAAHTSTPMDDGVLWDHVLAVMLGAGCLLTAAMAALVLEAVLASAFARSQPRATDRNTGPWAGGPVLLEQGGSEVDGAIVVAVVQGRTGRPTMLVSDESEAHGTRVRRLRFFYDPQVCGAELVSNIIQTEMLIREDGTVDRTRLSTHWNRLIVASLVYAGAARIPLGCACVLGHGCGALSSFLEEVLLADVAAVEKDEQVCDMGRAYFADSAHVHIDDAAEFVIKSSSSAKFDVVFVDINAEDDEPMAAPPASIYAEETSRALSRMSPVVLVNVLPASQTGPDHYQRIEDTFARHFPATRWLHSTLCSNRILVASAKEYTSMEVLNARMGAWKKLSQALAQSLDGIEYGSNILPRG